MNVIPFPNRQRGHALTGPSNVAFSAARMLLGLLIGALCVALWLLLAVLRAIPER
jgi:hypothetical protein